jgi:hypothetical protein
VEIYCRRKDTHERVADNSEALVAVPMYRDLKERICRAVPRKCDECDVIEGAKENRHLIGLTLIGHPSFERLVGPALKVLEEMNRARVKEKTRYAPAADEILASQRGVAICSRAFPRSACQTDDD